MAGEKKGRNVMRAVLCWGVLIAMGCTIKARIDVHDKRSAGPPQVYQAASSPAAEYQEHCTTLSGWPVGTTVKMEAFYIGGDLPKEIEITWWDSISKTYPSEPGANLGDVIMSDLMTLGGTGPVQVCFWHGSPRTTSYALGYITPYPSRKDVDASDNRPGSENEAAEAEPEGEAGGAPAPPTADIKVVFTVQ